MNPLQLAVHFLFQLAVILLACQAVGVLGRRLGQPQVVSEMIAGVMLGPSVLGLFWPEAFGRIFPPATMQVLFPVAQLGLAAYVFLVGVEFRLDIIRRHVGSVLAVSLAGMLAPVALGAILGWYIFHQTTLFPAGVTLEAACVFLGAALSVTAFPMLARIIQFKKLTGTAMGTVSLGAGALNDVAAWFLLAWVLARGGEGGGGLLLMLGGGVGYVLLTWLAVRPLLARWARGIEARGHLSDQEFVCCLIALVLAAWFTELIGLHAVFGAFVMGAAMPRGIVTMALVERIQPLTVALLLPLFFAYSGLNTRVDLLDSSGLWLLAGLVLVAAIGGKGVACWLAARATGSSHREALGIGTLMNVRGLMGLIVVNIGLERGVISPPLFAILAFVAVVTTLMASPLFDWLMAFRRPAGMPSLHEKS